jgi:hypothetical protein
MTKAKYLFLLFFALLWGCKEIYEPEINNTNTAIVIQGIITNTPGQVSVRISKAVSFDSTDNRQPIEKAIVTIRDDQGGEYKLFHTGSGVYSSNSLYALPDRTYSLAVTTADGSIYESSGQKLSKSFKQDSIYGNYVTKKILTQGSYGNYIFVSEDGIETFVDLSSGTTEIPKCRYEVKVTVLFSYPLPGLPPPTMYCWKTFDTNRNLNVTKTRFDKSSGIVKKHNINFFSNKLFTYDDRPNLNLVAFLLTLNKYNLTAESHKFYEDLNNQLTASGKIFDPTPSQLIGNIKCTSNPDKKVFGLFEVSSTERYFYRYNMHRIVFLTQKDSFPDFTEEGEVINVPPAFWY